MNEIHFDSTPIVQEGRTYVDDEGFVVREGKIMQCGVFADKGGFELTHADVDRNIGRPAPNDLEHIATALTHNYDGTRRSENHVGDTTITRRDGDDVYGRVRTPYWLHRIIGDEGMKVSTTWTPDTKELVGTAVCLNPRIADAAVFAAFAADPSFPAFAASHPDAAGLVNAAIKAPNPANPMNPQEIKDAAWTTFSADPKNAGVTRERFEAAFATGAPAPTTDAEQERRLAALEADRERQNAEFADRDDLYNAKEMYGEMLQAGKIDPAEKDAFLSRFTRCAKADRAMGVTFSDGKEKSLVADLKAEWDGKPAKRTFGGQRLDSGATVEFSGANALGIFSEDDFRKTEGK